MTRTSQLPPQSPYIRLWTSTFGVVAVLKRTGSAGSLESIIDICNMCGICDYPSKWLLMFYRAVLPMYPCHCLLQVDTVLCSSPIGRFKISKTDTLLIMNRNLEWRRSPPCYCSEMNRSTRTTMFSPITVTIWLLIFYPIWVHPHLLSTWSHYSSWTYERQLILCTSVQTYTHVRSALPWSHIGCGQEEYMNRCYFPKAVFT